MRGGRQVIWEGTDRKSTRLNSSHRTISYAVFCLKKKSEKEGYTATKHQREAGTAYFDQLLMTITGGESSTTALHGSTESEQFVDRVPGLADVAARTNGTCFFF